jgi:large repetitive protein
VSRPTKAFSLATVVAVLAVAAVIVSPAGAVLSAPAPITPLEGAEIEGVPPFEWSAVSGAARYEWEISADPGFNSPVLGLNLDHFFTRNTWATLTKTIPDGTYWWHARAVAANGDVGPWSASRSFVKQWAEQRFQPALLAPSNGSDVTYPTDVFRLAWTPVPGAVKYLVSVATDPSLGSLVWSGTAKETQASSFTPLLQLAPGQTYYWGVTPVDAEGNHGAASDVWSFTWRWNSATTTSRQDVAAAPEIYDWQFSWGAVPGAAGYEIEISTSSEFAPGSKVCCAVNLATKVTTIGTKYTPPVALKNNTYYWRVRAIDPSRNAGQWNEGTPFLKSFDNGNPSVQNLRMLDDPTPADGGFSTSTPIVAWDPVPGASAYGVEVTKYVDGTGCDWTATSEHWGQNGSLTTTTTAWTPLGSGWNNIKPFASANSVSVAWDVPSLVAGHTYCVKVTPLDKPSDITGQYISAPPTYLPSIDQPAFTWTGPNAGTPCSPSCNSGSLGSGDYLTPVSGTTTAGMPVFRWKPIAGAASYYVLVSKDPDFTNLADYGFTQVPAYAPRLTSGTRTYPDESADTPYYWAVLPASTANGGGVTTAPTFSAPQNFVKESPAPDLVAPANGAVFSGPVTFSWNPVPGARDYRLQVSTDPSFSSGILENATTDSTAFTSDKSYVADTNLYWRVRADAESTDAPFGVGLTWSNEDTTPDLRSFRKTLAPPVPDPANAVSGIDLPTWKWSTVPGAVSYDFHLELPNHQSSDFSGLPSAAATPILLKGTGAWHWQVRANFPQVDSLALTKGPWSDRMAFTRTIPEPSNPREDAADGGVVLRWDARLGAVNYRVQISTTEDFSSPVESATTETTSYAPKLMLPAYLTGGTFYWRVAAADDLVANVGDYTGARTFTLTSAPVTRQATTVTLQVTKTSSKLKAGGGVTPSAGGQVTVKLYRKSGGVFHLLSTKSPMLTALSTYNTSFARPGSGKCKIVSRYEGDAAHAASRRALTFGC